MKEFVFCYYRNGYLMENTKNSAPFGGENTVKLIVTPQEYELKLSGEVLRKMSCKGYGIMITRQGAAKFYDAQERLLAEVGETQKDYREFQLEWQPDKLFVRFGHIEEVDNYPNCDGESDRWSTSWEKDYEIVFNTVDNTVKTSE